jgi:hypothetical protein
MKLSDPVALPHLANVAQGIISFLSATWFRLALLLLVGIGLGIVREHLRLMRDLRSQELQAAEQRYLANSQREERHYIAKRRNDCYDIYARERARFNNTKGLDYDVESDQCEVIYRNTGAPGPICARIARDTSDVFWRGTSRFAVNLRIDCADHAFRNSF